MKTHINVVFLTTIPGISIVLKIQNSNIFSHFQSKVAIIATSVCAIDEFFIAKPQKWGLSEMIEGSTISGLWIVLKIQISDFFSHFQPFLAKNCYFSHFRLSKMSILYRKPLEMGSIWKDQGVCHIWAVISSQDTKFRLFQPFSAIFS